MLACSARTSACTRVPSGVFRNHSAVSYLGYPNIVTFYKANAPSAKAIKDEIQKLNEHPLLSPEYKFRNSHRLFAELDHCKVMMEVKASLERFARHVPDVNATMVMRASHEDHLLWASLLDDIKVSHRRLASAQWNVFRISVFAPYGDVSLAERLWRIPLFIGPAVLCAQFRALLYVGTRCLAAIIRQGTMPLHSPGMHLAD